MTDGYRKTLNGGNIPAVVTKCDVSGDGCKGNAKNAELPSVLQVRQSWILSKQPMDAAEQSSRHRPSSAL